MRGPVVASGSHDPGAVPRDAQISGLAAVRALGCVLIVLGHASIAYMTSPPASIAWPVHDDGSRACDALYLWCRGAQCGFFVLSGIMAAAAMRHDLRGFLRSRLRLLGRPLLIGLVTVLPLCYLVWMLGWWRTGYITLEQMTDFRLATEDKRKLLGLGHLWYLEYLLVYCIVYAGWRLARGPVRGSVGPLRLFGAILALSAWAAAWALFDPSMITDFDNGFVPRWTYLAYNGGFFALGAVLWRARETLNASAALWAPLLLMAQGLFALWLWLIQRHAIATESTAAAVAFAVVNALAFTAWALVTRWNAGRAGSATRALVRSAYFTYLTHLPIVGLVQVALWRTPLPPLVKFLITGAVGLGVPMLLHRMVRSASADRTVTAAYSSPAR